MLYSYLSLVNYLHIFTLNELLRSFVNFFNIDYFKCNYFDEAEEDLGERKAWLYKDYSIDCYSTRYINYKFYAGAMILVYHVGIPLVYYLLLDQRRDILSNDKELAKEKAKNFPNICHLMFLVESYKPEYYYFEVIEVVRRLLLASVIGVVEAKSAAAPTIGLLICFIFLYIFIDLKPYKNTSDCNLGIVLQYSIALFFLSALLIKVDATWDSANDQEIFGHFLMGILFIGPTMIIFQLISTYIKKERRKKVGDDEGVKKVVNNIGYLEDQTEVTMARWCVCGNVYRPDSVFCRKCAT